MTTSEQTNAALRCPNCGGNIVFDPEAQQFRCASCGSTQNVTPGKDRIEEYDFSEYRAREGRRMLENGETAMRCDGCGEEFFLPAQETATVCPMCGAPLLRQESEHNGIPVEGVIPFAIDRYEAQKLFGKWIGKRWFAPSSLKRTFAEGKLVGMYVPFWTYDVDAVTNYSGRGGRTHTRTRNGKTETYTQWYPVSGVVRGRYDDIQVCASRTASGNLIQQVLPYNTIGNTRPYHPQYLAGYQAECYTVDGIEAFHIAETFVDRDQRGRAESDIRSHGYSQAQVTGMNTRYETVRYKHVLLPLWKAKYGYGGKTYHYMINGETGKVSAQYPKSPWKILLVVLLALAVFFGGLALLEGTGGSSGGGSYYYSDTGGSYDSGYDGDSYGGYYDSGDFGWDSYDSYDAYDYYDYGTYDSWDDGGYDYSYDSWDYDYGSYDYGYDWGGDW